MQRTIAIDPEAFASSLTDGLANILLLPDGIDPDSPDLNSHQEPPQEIAWRLEQLKQIQELVQGKLTKEAEEAEKERRDFLEHLAGIRGSDMPSWKKRTMILEEESDELSYRIRQVIQDSGLSNGATVIALETLLDKANQES
jgi:hypothetical protein